MKPRGPELIWPGKYDDDGQRVEVPRPGAVLEVRERIGGSASCDRLLHGDNLEALDALHATHRGKVDLVYIDPPFATGGRFSVATRVGQSQGRKAAPEISAPAYSDRFDAGATGFLQMLEPRLRLMHELLSPRGSFYLHVDPTVGHMVKLLLDEVFGAACFQREIVWRIGWVSGFKSKAKNWIRNHDLIFFYVKDPRAFTFNKKYVPYPPGYVRRDGKPPTGKGVPIDDVWNANESEFALRGKESLDSIQIKSFSNEKCGYATQKNESLATRIIEASSNPGDLVADFFCGSGTVGVAARRLGRRFVGSDCSAAAVHIAKKRLLEVESEAALSIERAHVPGRAQDHCAKVAAHMGLSMDPAGRFHARREGRAVHIAEADARMNAETIASLCAELPDDVEGLDVVSSRYDLPLLWSPPSGVAVRLLRVTEEVHNAAASTVHGAAIRELPRVQLQAVLVDEGFALELVAYDLDPQSLQPQLRDALREPLDLVDAWSVTWRATPLLAVQTDAVFQRTHQRRTLPTRTNVQPLPSEPVTVTIRVVDVLYQHSTITAKVQPCADGVVLTDLRLC